MIKKFDIYNESVRDKMTPKSEEEVRSAIKKIIGIDEDYIEVKIPMVKEPKKVRILLELSDKHNIDIQDYDDNNLIVCGDITDVFYFIKFWVNYTLINKQNKREFFINYILRNTVKKITESIRDKMTPKSKEELMVSYNNLLNSHKEIKKRFILMEIISKKQFNFRNGNVIRSIDVMDLSDEDLNDLIKRYYIDDIMLGEGVRDKMTPKTEDDIKSSIESLLFDLGYTSDMKESVLDAIKKELGKGWRDKGMDEFATNDLSHLYLYIWYDFNIKYISQYREIGQFRKMIQNILPKLIKKYNIGNGN